MLNVILSVFILIAEVWAILNVAQSRVTTQIKTIWILVILLLPVLGVVIWYFAGPKTGEE